MLSIDAGTSLQQADLFLFTATGPDGDELYTWSWPVIQTWEKAAEILKTLPSGESEINIRETEKAVITSVNNLEISFSKADGTLLSVRNKKGNISFTGGPVPAGVKSEITGVTWIKETNGKFSLEITTGNYPEKMKWTLDKNGLLLLEASQIHKALQDIDFLGISFNYPEEKCTGVKWMGRGPYRVWKNRLKGANIGVWEKAYNNTVTGETFNNLIYPEFKGYHGNLYWIQLETTESPVTIISETPNLFLQLFKPDKPQHVAGGTHPPFPDGDISFLYEIPAIGTKFKQPEALGPKSGKGQFRGRNGDEGYPIRLWFDFR